MWTSYRTPLILGSFLLLLILLTGCSGAESLEGETISYPNPVPPCPPDTCAAGVPARFSGWLTIIRNGHTIYRLTNEEGLSVELLIDEPLLVSLGGAQALHRKHVTVTGEWTADQPAKIKALTIQVDQ